MDVARFLLNTEITRIEPALARKRWGVFRELNGYRAGRPLLSPAEENMKLEKAGKADVAVTIGLSLAQSNTSGHNVCRYSTGICRACCVGNLGNRSFESSQKAAQLKTRWLLADPSAFVSLLAAEIDQAVLMQGSSLQVRLNTFSDLPWERIVPWLFEERPNVLFYDYTKWPDRTPPANYRIIFSASERTTDDDIVRRVGGGQNVAVVFDVTRGNPLPASHLAIPVIDGDIHDARWLDPLGVIVGLRAKGSIRRVGAAMLRVPELNTPTHPKGH